MQDLQKFIQLIYEAIAAPDASPNAEMGKYLFAPDRKDVPKPPEKNTTFEEKFFSALSSWYGGNKKHLVKLAPKIFEFMKKGQYRKFLSPPKVPAYRYLFNVKPNKAAQILGLSVEDIKEEPNKPWYVKVNSIVKPVISPLQSWTINANSRTFENVEIDVNFSDPDESQVIILLIAKPTNRTNKFFINPNELLHKVHNLESYAYQEWETISYGPVQIEEAVYMYIGQSNQDTKLKLEKVMRKITEYWINALGPAPKTIGKRPHFGATYTSEMIKWVKQNKQYFDWHSKKRNIERITYHLYALMHDNENINKNLYNKWITKLPKELKQEFNLIFQKHQKDFKNKPKIDDFDSMNKAFLNVLNTKPPKHSLGKANKMHLKYYDQDMDDW